MPGGMRRMTAYGSCEQGLRSMPINPKVEWRRDTTSSLTAEQYSRPSERPDPTVIGYLRQVTTATPARLDLRASGVADEGCADTMSTESPCSMVLVTSSAQGCSVSCHLQAPGTEIASREITVSEPSSHWGIWITQNKYSYYLLQWHSTGQYVQGH